LPDRPTDSEIRLAWPGAPRPFAKSSAPGKGLAGLDEHQVRSWTSWQRWTVFAMLAHVLLAVIATHDDATRPARTGPLSTPKQHFARHNDLRLEY
jgi:hypothetical protein